MKGASHLLGLYWDELQPAFFMRENDRTPKESPLPIGYGSGITLRLVGTRHCVGYVEPSSRLKVVCPTNATIPEGPESQCANCRRYSVARFSVTQLQRLQDPAIANLLAAPHILYVALFGRDLVKVGVSTLDRYKQRLVEQGAHSALVVAFGDGLQVRQAERALATSAGITERIPFEAKVSRLSQYYGESDARSLLVQRLSRAHTTDDCGWVRWSTRPRFVCNAERFNLVAVKDIVSMRAVRSMRPDDTFSGSILACCGTILIVKSVSSDIFALDARRTSGFDVAFSPTVGPMVIADQHVISLGGRATQASLFD